MLEDKNFTYDYEKYPLGYVVPDLENKSVEIVKGEKNHGFGNFKEAENWARQNIARIYSDEETGGKGEILISINSIRKYLSEKAVSKSFSRDIHLSTLKILPLAIKNGIIAEIHPDFLKNKFGKRLPENGINNRVLIYRIFCAISLDYQLFRVKITIKEIIDKNMINIPHSYETTKIELLSGTLVGNNINPRPNNSILVSDTDSPVSKNTDASISAAKLLKNVEMSYWKGKYFF